ncbi:MAG: galactose mutarotase [Lachnospiraceae bacterium]|nr:galactose mutarotase [Lachnospiraceae bacterium]
MKKELYGKTTDGKDVFQYTVTNKNGMEMTVMDFGAILLNVIVPDKNGAKKDVVLACDSMETYRVNGCYFGSTIAPSANRIADAEVTIDGIRYQLDVNDNENNLHTNFPNGMNKRIWNAEETENGVRFTFVLDDMEYNLPGRRELAVTYTLTDDNEICIDYEGDSDKNTVINPTNHTYFNLDGHTSNNILNQKLLLHASNYTPVRAGSIPTGEIASVKGTPFDFTEWKTIGEEIDEDVEQLKLTGGYDHNFVVDNYDGTVKEIAQARSEETGIVLTVLSDLPGVQFYAGNYINGEKGKEEMVYGKRSGFCLETQYYPDSVHHANFPSVIFGPERPFRSTTIFKFGV